MLSIHLTVLTWAAGHRDFGVSVSQRLLWYQGRSESLRCSLAKLVPESASGRVMVDAASSVDRLMVDAASSVDCLGIHWQVQRTIKCRAFPRSNAGTGWNCSLIRDIFQKNKKIPDKTLFQTSFSYRDQDAESTCNEVASSFFLCQLLLSRTNDSETLNILSLGVKPPLKKWYYSQIGKIVSRFGVNFWFETTAYSLASPHGTMRQGLLVNNSAPENGWLGNNFHFGPLRLF